MTGSFPSRKFSVTATERMFFSVGHSMWFFSFWNCGCCSWDPCEGSCATYLFALLVLHGNELFWHHPMPNFRIVRNSSPDSHVIISMFFWILFATVPTMSLWCEGKPLFLVNNFDMFTLTFVLQVSVPGQLTWLLGLSVVDAGSVDMKENLPQSRQTDQKQKHTFEHKRSP